MATKKNPEEVPGIPLPPTPPSSPEPSAPGDLNAPENDAPDAGAPSAPPTPYGAPEATVVEPPAESPVDSPVDSTAAAERPNPYASPVPPVASPAYSAPPTPPAAYGTPPAAAYGAPQAPAAAPPAYGSQQPYGTPGAYYPPAALPQGMSLASMITGIGSIVFTFAGFGFLPGIAAVILGHIAKKSQPHARGLWMTGLITGYISIGLGLLTGIIIIAVFAIAAAAGSSGY